MRPLLRAIEDLDVEALALRDAAELVYVTLERGHHEDAGARLVARVEGDAVAEHAAVLVEEARVAGLADLHRGHVVGEAVVERLDRVGAAEDPLLQRRLVPDADGLAHGVMLLDRVAEVGDPIPALPLGEGATLPTLDRIEGGLAQALGGDGRNGRRHELDAGGLSGR